MTAPEFKRVFAYANDFSNEMSYSDPALNRFDGFGLKDFKNIVATVRECALILRYQCLYIFHKRGESPWDMDEVNNMREFFRYKVTLID